MHDRISPRQLSALTCAAACAPIFQLCCRISWVWTAVGGLSAAILVPGLCRLAARRPLRRAARRLPGRVLLFLGALGLTLLAVRTAARSGRAFPETAGSLPAAALMLGLALWAVRQGTATLGRCAGILLPASIILYCIVLGFSAPGIRPERLAPSGSPMDALSVLSGLSVQAAGICLPEDTVPAAPHSPWPARLTAALAVMASVVTGGVLSPAAAARPGSFGVLAKSVSLLGVMQRFEALVSAAMLMSSFCLCALLLAAASALLRMLGPEDASKSLKKLKKSKNKC